MTTLISQSVSGQDLGIALGQGTESVLGIVEDDKVLGQERGKEFGFVNTNHAMPFGLRVRE